MYRVAQKLGKFLHALELLSNVDQLSNFLRSQNNNNNNNNTKFI